MQAKLTAVKDAVLRAVPDSDINPLRTEVAITGLLYSGVFRMPVDLIVKQSGKFNRNKEDATFEKVVARTGVRIYEKVANASVCHRKR
jgi:hypothetical protein